RTEIVTLFLTSVGKSSLQKELLGSSLVYWRDSPDEDYYIVEYSRIFDDLFFRFEDAATPSELSTTFVTRDSLPSYFTNFVNQYFKGDFQFTNFNITAVPEGYRVEANRLIDGVPLERSGSAKYSDYVIFQEDGDVVEGSITLLTINPSTGIET